jgi:MOSC domain-containing protein YiiM
MHPSPQTISSPPAIAPGQLVSVNVARPRTVRWQGRQVTSSIWKLPVSGPIAVRGVNLAGDDQADRRFHGGPDKAVYAYSLDDYRFWRDEFGLSVEAGLFGENLTIDGLDLSGARIGERWQIGSVLLEVSQPRIPCFKLAMRTQDAAFPRRFAAAERPGAYLRILREGTLQSGDAVTVVHRPDHEVSVAFISRAYHSDRSLRPRLLEIPGLADSWRDWAERLVAAKEAKAAARQRQLASRELDRT